MGDLSFYAEVKSDVRAEVILRTPGFISWQQTLWLSHCKDACEYHGDASVQDVKNVPQETKRDWLATFHLNEQVWQQIADGYQPWVRCSSIQVCLSPLRFGSLRSRLPMSKRDRSLR
jgi:uncharacterized protein CbrC (UPF0167 family)